MNPNSADGRVRRALVELWQDHQGMWPVGAHERLRLSVESRRVKDLANLRGGRTLGHDSVQTIGRLATRQGNTDLGDGLRFTYAQGRFDVWEER